MLEKESASSIAEIVVYLSSFRQRGRDARATLVAYLFSQSLKNSIILAKFKPEWPQSGPT